MTFTHCPIHFTKLEQKNLAGGRVYCVAEGQDLGQTYPSITRILGARPKPQLDAWRARVGETAAAKKSNQATTRGHTVHAAAELLLNNRHAELQQLEAIMSFGTKDMWLRLKGWIVAHVDNVRAQEVDLYSSRLRVAGRTDLFADVDGISSVVDFKNSTKEKQEKYVTDYYLQGTFYSLAAFEMTGIPVKQIVVPIISPDGLQIFTTRPSEHFTGLRARIAEYYDKYHIDNP